MARILSRRSQEREPESGNERTVDSEHNVKIEKATERAAAAVRKAAAQAAADRAHARARTSALAVLGLVLGVVAVLAVLTGALAALGIAVGALALLAGLAGLSASGRHYSYLAGRNVAVVGLLLAVGAVVLGILAVTGVLSAIGTDTNQVERLQELLPSWLS